MYEAANIRRFMQASAQQEARSPYSANFFGACGEKIVKRSELRGYRGISPKYTRSKKHGRRTRRIFSELAESFLHGAFRALHSDLASSIISLIHVLMLLKVFDFPPLAFHTMYEAAAEGDKSVWSPYSANFL